MEERPRRRWRDLAGFSVAEVTTVLTAMSILSGIAAPAVNDYVEQAKAIRARHDVHAISISLVRMFSDVGPLDARERGAWADYDLLVSAGAIPGATADAMVWATPAEEGRVGSLDDHLVTNRAQYAPAEAHVRGWRGPYLQDHIGADPWGQRLAVNVESLAQPGSLTVVLSAGANGIAESSARGSGLPTAGDDVVAVLSR